MKNIKEDFLKLCVSEKECKLLNSKELSKKMGVSERMIRTIRENRKIDYYKIGHNVRFHPKDVYDFLTRLEYDDSKLGIKLKEIINK